jgi:hypothetical protein
MLRKPEPRVRKTDSSTRAPAALACRLRVRYPGIRNRLAALIALDGCGSTVARDAHPAGTKECPVMAVKVYLGYAQAAHGEMTYEEADAFHVTAGGFLLIQHQHSGEQKDLAVFAPGAWLHAEVVREPAPGSR